MKSEGYLFAFFTVFFLVVTVVYWLLSSDPTGTTCLALTMGLSFMVGYYLLFTARRIEARPEDRLDGEISHGGGARSVSSRPTHGGRSRSRPVLGSLLSVSSSDCSCSSSDSSRSRRPPWASSSSTTSASTAHRARHSARSSRWARARPAPGSSLGTERRRSRRQRPAGEATGTGGSARVLAEVCSRVHL